MGKKRPATEGHPQKDKRQKRERTNNAAPRPVKPKETLVFSPRPDWHAAEVPEIPIAEEAKSPPGHVVQALHDHATQLLAAESALYSKLNSTKNSSTKFMKDLMTSGTLEDKVSALTLVVQESPLHNIKAFENLLGLASKRSRSQAIMALGALKDLLGAGVVLPPERKLRAFGRQPGLISALQGRAVSWKAGDNLPGKLTEIHLIVWAYEDWLKRTYFDILKVLETWSNDEVEYSRLRAVTFVWELLKEKPEQEENLLRLLVNKLGDTEKKVASRASYLLLQLQVAHPAMKLTIISAIEADLLFRPGQSLHARYYAIITINQTILSSREPEVAVKLLDIYFSLFVGLLKDGKGSTDTDGASKATVQGGGGKAGRKARQKEKAREAAAEQELQLRERLVAQILTGVNRAYPFSDAQSEVINTHLDTLFRVTHSANLNTSIQAMVLIFQITAAKQQSADRYYRTLYESLLDPRLLTSSKQIMYLNLLYRSLRADLNLKRVKAFVKRMLQVIAMHEPAFACGVLFLINELQTTFPAIKTMLCEPEASPEDEEETFHDAPEDGDGVPDPEATAASTKKTAYDPRKRDPEYSNADQSCLWELIPLVAHYHPSVSLFAARLIQSEAFDKQRPDPSTFTLNHFLNRFIYRNARTKSSGLRGSSLMQPLAGTNAADLLYKDRVTGREGDILNTEEFWSKKRDDVRVDEVFFHNYFEKAGKVQQKSRAERRAAKRASPGEDGLVVEVEDDEDEDEEAEIWKALVGSRPEIEGKGSEDDFEDDDEDVDIGEFMDDDEEGVEDDVGEQEDGEGLGGVSFHGFGESEGEDENAGAEKAVLKSEKKAGKKMKMQSEPVEASDDDFDVAALEDEDEGALFDSDDEIPENVELPQDKIEELAKGIKSKDKRKRKRSLKSLPTFASAEDYAKLLGDDDDGDL